MTPLPVPQCEVCGNPRGSVAVQVSSNRCLPCWAEAWVARRELAAIGRGEGQ